MDARYYSFNKYLQDRFGCRVHRLSLNAGFGCPNLDGTLSSDGCIFCANKAFSHFAENPGVPLKDQLAQAKAFAQKRFKAEKFIAYFQSFSATYADPDHLKKQYSVIEGDDDIVGLAISTRPDCIDDAKLDVIESFSSKYEVYLEYGLQSVHDQTLAAINRNHAFADFQKAVGMTAGRKIHVACHVILGLPGETLADIFATAKKLAELPLWGVKFHCLHVVKDTALEKLYNSQRLRLFSRDEYIDALVGFLEILPPQFVVLRLVSDADPRYLVAPAWVNDKPKFILEFERELKQRDSFQGKSYGSISPKS